MAESELYWSVRIDPVPSIVLAVLGVVNSCILPVGADARWDHCESV